MFFWARQVLAAMPRFSSSFSSIQPNRKLPAYLSLILLLAAWPAAAVPGPKSTTTTLAVTSSTGTVTSVAYGTTVTLTATVTPASGTITAGQVLFCDGGVTYCEDVHVIGMAQITSAGTATIKVHPLPGSYSYEAVFVGTTLFTGSKSGVSDLTVTGLYPTITMLTESGLGTPGDYSLTALVNGSAKDGAVPTGPVSFVDTTVGNAVLGTADLGNVGTVLLGNVANPVLIPAGNTYVYSAVAGDFNGDGNQDLALEEAITGQGTWMNVLFGDGAGNFTQASGYPIASPGPLTLVQDFNGDGIPDILSSSTGGISILLGNGDGTFRTAPGSPFYTNYGYGPVVAADFNGDGIPDFAVAGGYYLIVYLGNGDGSFTEVPITASTISEANFESMVAGDFNNDGIPDLATMTAPLGPVTIYLGNGDGTFQPGTNVVSSIESSGSGVYLAAGDFNGDGNLDLAVPVYGSTGQVMVLLGNGNGTFYQPTGSPYAAPSFASSVAVGDFNGDGIPDLFLSAQTNLANAGVLLGKGDGTFTPALTTPPELPCCYPIVSDFNGDRLSDVVTPSEQAGIVQVLFADDATASAPVNGINSIGPGTDQVVAEFPGDGNFTPSTSTSLGLIAAVAKPTFNPPPGTYTSGQQVTISTTTPNSAIYYTTNGSTPTQTPSEEYTNPITVSGSETVKAIGYNSNYYPSVMASAAYVILPPPTISGISPAVAVAGNAAFTLTVSGTNFAGTSKVMWGATALTTTYVSPTEVTAQVTAAEIAVAGEIPVTVVTPAPGGGTSNAYTFEIDTAGSTAPAFTTTTVTLTAGTAGTASYPVTLSSSATNVSVTCLNLPAGATCSYAGGTLTITTTAATPAGTYSITAVFSETLPGAAAGLILLPFLLFPFAGTKKRKRAGMVLAALAGLVIAVALVGGGCGGGGGGSYTPPAPTTHSATSSGVVTLVVH